MTARAEAVARALATGAAHKALVRIAPSRNSTDLGNAERLVDMHGGDLRFAAGIGWLVWNGVRWERDHTGERFRRAKETVRGMYAEAAEIADDRERGALVQHAKRSESRERIRAMVDLAESDEKIAIRASDLDTDAWLLTVENGTVDLRTGKRREHRREDLITKLAPVTADSSAPAPVFRAFLDTVFAHNEALSSFVQRFVGYCLTGDVREQVLFFAHGKGRNGKSTFIEIVLSMLGDYAMAAAPGLLVAKKSEAHPTELADLFGSRLVASVEIGDGKRWDEEVVKKLTGGDQIKARLMRQDFFAFRPTHKIVVSANHKPEVHGTDLAIWRRILLVPFEVTIPEADVDALLPEKLRAELPGILQWAIEGCIAWQSGGLRPPACVTEATAAYRSESDVVGRFIEERCFVSPDVSAKAAQLYTAFKEWCLEAGEYPSTQRKFGLSLGERGLKSTKSHGTTTYRGLGVRQ